MSKNNRRPRSNKPTRTAVLEQPQEQRRQAQIRPGGQNFQQISDAVQNQMYAAMSAQSPQTATTMYAPGAPIRPIPGITPIEGPRQFAYGVGTNISSLPRGTEDYSFADLRALAKLFDAVQICEQVWFDYVSKLELVIEPLPELVDEDGDISMYAPDISRYLEFFEFPDKEHDLHSWLRMAVREQLEIDALAIYVRKDKGGRPYSLDILDGSLLKPLLDDRGRRPMPPFPAYEQFVYGVPAALLTSDDLLYVKETEQTDSVYGRSRIERAILRINQALRKQSRDMARFTDGTVPAGFIQPSMDINWTQDELATFEAMLNNLLAGNDQLRARAKVLPKGFTFVSTDEKEIKSEFDLFIITIIAACFGLTLDELAITLTSNRSVGASQENVLYRRAIQPLMMHYQRVLTHILRKYFNEKRFIVKFAGFIEHEDFNTQAQAYSTLTGSGILGLSEAARLLKLPHRDNDQYIGRILPTKAGPPVFLDDVASPEARQAQLDATMAGFKLAANPQQQSHQDGQDTPDDEEGNTLTKAAPMQSKGKAPAPDNDAPTKDDVKRLLEQSERLMREVERWAFRPESEDEAIPLPERTVVQAAKRAALRRAGESSQPAAQPVHTGMMLAFLLDPQTAEQLALPDGEPASDLHCTLCFMGDVSDFPGSLDALKSTVASFAASQEALQGKVSGVGRFTPSDSSDGLAPVYASVDVQGLHTFREKLVQTLGLEDFHVANDFSYQPHITLCSIDENAPTPITSVPALSLVFDVLCLSIGDERTFYPLRTPTLSPNERNTLRSEIDAKLLSAEHRRWREVALKDVRSGRSVRDFCSNIIPQRELRTISRILSYCTTDGEINALFRAAKEQAPLVWEPPDTDAHLAMLARHGVATQTWVSHANACGPICLLNDGETIPINGTFKGLQRLVYGHPNCVCTAVYRDADGAIVKAPQYDATKPVEAST